MESNRMKLGKGNGRQDVRKSFLLQKFVRL